MLNRKLYTGEYEVNGKEYNNIYPQIISKELYTQVQKRLAKTRYGCRKENHEVFLLRNKIYCGCCRRKMYPVSSNSYNKPLRYYACYNTEKEDGCSTKRVYKDFIEDVVNTVIQATFKNPTNLKNISTKIYEIYKKQNAKNNSLVALKNDLQKVNNSISNIMIAIEKGVITNTTKSRLQELETQQLELQQKIVIEQSKQRFELTKEDIKDTFESMLKESSNAVIDYLIRYVRVFQGRIEISLNNMLEQTDENYIPYIQKIYTATHTTERLLKGGKTHTKSENYEVYIII